MNRSAVSPFKVWCCIFVLIQVTMGVENISDPVYSGLVCGWSTLEAKCGFGDVIHVIRANYGRTSLLPCNDDNLPWDVDCDFLGSNEIVKRRCEQKWSCKVPATTSVFGDPCIGTQKYLEMDMQCKPGKPLVIAVDSGIGIQVFDIKTSEDYLFEGEIRTIKDITALDFVYRTKTVVWTDSRTHRIYRAPIESRGQTTTLSSNSIQPMGLAVDWIHGKLYWTDNGKKTISVANLDGSWEKTLVFEANNTKLGSIVVDPIQGWMFWTDIGDEPKIERAGMDGSHRSAIISIDTDWPISIALDLSSHKIFWMDALRGQISTANYDGTQRATVLSSYKLLGAASINFFKDYIYWINFGKIFMVKIGAVIVGDYLYGRVWRNLKNIKIFHNSQQPAGPNRCGTNYGGCSHLCLPTPELHGISRPDSKQYRCVCPNNVRNCSEAVLTENDDQHDEINSSSQVVPFIMTKLLVLVALVKHIASPTNFT